MSPRGFVFFFGFRHFESLLSFPPSLILTFSFCFHESPFGAHGPALAAQAPNPSMFVFVYLGVVGVDVILCFVRPHHHHFSDHSSYLLIFACFARIEVHPIPTQHAPSQQTSHKCDRRETKPALSFPGSVHPTTPIIDWNAAVLQVTTVRVTVSPRAHPHTRVICPTGCWVLNLNWFPRSHHHDHHIAQIDMCRACTRDRCSPQARRRAHNPQ